VIGDTDPGLLPFPATLDPLLEITIAGDPAGQGSMTVFPSGGMAYPKATRNHRDRVIYDLEQLWAGRAPITGPVQVDATFTMRRPDSHYKNETLHRRGRTVLREDAPAWHTVKNRGDVDKLARLIGDALEISRALDHDSLIVRWLIEKPYGAEGSTRLRVIRAPLPKGYE
jgi:Holliday junction resolvase RusA-like endonuclease